jgi:sphinganine-1-phosphate aldolase
MVAQIGLSNPFTPAIDFSFFEQQHWQDIALVVGSVVTYEFFRRVVLNKDWKQISGNFILKLPFVAKEIDKEILKFKTELEKKIFSEGEICEFLPEEGLEAECLKEEMLQANHDHWKNGQATGAVYHNREEIKEVIIEALKNFLPSNPLHPELFPDIRRFEASVVSMVRNMFHGDDLVCGQVTSGGTESLLLACLAARNRGKALYGIDHAEIIIPTSAHASFKKAEELFGIKVIEIPVDSDTYEADVAKIKKAITSNTVMIVASCPCYPYGIIDPISQLSEVVEKYQGRIGLHVDACLGGFLVPFMSNLPLYDFRLKGVTSLSADTHKYGYAPKGTSVVLYRDENWFKHQISKHVKWTGGIYGTPTLAGSRSGAVIAATYAVMRYMGKNGYKEAVGKIIEITECLANEIKKIEELEILGDPKVSVIAFRFKKDNLDIYQLKDKMKQKGWHLSELQFVAALHFCLTLVHADQKEFISNFVKDLKESIQELNNDPGGKKTGTAALYGTMQRIPAMVSWIAPFIFNRFVDAYFITMVSHKPRVWKGGIPIVPFSFGKAAQREEEHGVST